MLVEQLGEPDPGPDGWRVATPEDRSASMSSIIVKLARGSSAPGPAGRKASPTGQASAGHSSNPSLASTSTAYMNPPPMNSASDQRRQRSDVLLQQVQAVDRRLVFRAIEVITECPR